MFVEFFTFKNIYFELEMLSEDFFKISERKFDIIILISPLSKIIITNLQLKFGEKT